MEKGLFTGILVPPIRKMLCHPMQNKISNIVAKLGKYWNKGVEMEELNDRERFI